MELAVELEDDVFFADIKKQISLLFMDEDDHPPPPLPLPLSSSLSFQDLLGGNYQTAGIAATAAAMSPFMYDERWGRRESKGTGVFIPRSSQPRRRHPHPRPHKHGRFSSFNPKSQSRQNLQHHENSNINGNVSYPGRV